MNKKIFGKKVELFLAAVIIISLILMLIYSFNIAKLNSKKSVSSSPSPTPSPTNRPTPSVGRFSPTPIPTPKPSPSPSPSPSPTPTPTPKPIPIIINNEQLNSFFSKYAGEYGVDEELLKYIAECESNMNPQAVNGPYGGLFQFTPRTWAATRQTMPADPNPALRFNPEEAIKTAAFKISRGGIGAWPNCSY